VIDEPCTPWETLQQRGARPREIDREEYSRLLLSRRRLRWVWSARGVLEDLDTRERFVLATRDASAPQGA
jgi:hypothetical protein